MAIDDVDVDVKKVRICKDVVCVQETISRRGLFCKVDLESSLDAVRDSLVYRLIAYMARSEHEQVGYIDVPATWWQTFKYEHFPAWALKQWPVVYKGVRYTQKIHLCPHVYVDWGDRRHVDFLMSAAGKRRA